MQTEDPKLTGDARIDELLERVRKAATGKAVSASEWNEIAEFLDENPPATEERLMKEYTSGVTTGTENERARIVKYIEGQAAGYFIQHKDEKARETRELAKLVATGKA